MCTGEALKPIIRDRLPRGGIIDESSPGRSDPRITLEGTETDAHLLGVVGVAGEEVRTALATEALLESAVGMAPAADQPLSLDQVECAPANLSLS
jgi:hypothetical protein